MSLVFYMLYSISCLMFELKYQGQYQRYNFDKPAFDNFCWTYSIIREIDNLIVNGN